MQSETQIRFIELCETRNWDNDYFFSFGYFFELTEYLLLLGLQAIHIPGHGSGKKFTFALAQVEGPARASLECIKQSKNKRTMESLGKIRYKLKVQATDEIYETTRAKMAAANNAAKQNATKVIKESGPKVGRKIRVPTGASHGKSFSSGSGFGGRAAAHTTPAISVTAASSDKSAYSGTSHSASSQAKRGPRVAHSAPTALLSVPSPSQAYPVSNGSSQRSIGPSVPVTNKYSSHKSDVRKSELKADSRSPSAALCTNGYSDLISNWANKPTSPSVPEPALSLKTSSSHNVADSSSGSSCSSAGSPISADDRQKLKSEFNSLYAVYKALYATLDQVSTKFWRLEEKLKNSAEGSEEWNVSCSFLLTLFRLSLFPLLSSEHNGDHCEAVRGA